MQTRQVKVAYWPQSLDKASVWAKFSGLQQREQLAAAEWDRRWRALLLLCKAKLELVASGHSNFEREFLADILLPNGETVADAMVPRLELAYRDGTMPLLLGTGAA